MENEINDSIMENENTQPVQAEGRLFTQTEVDAIVKKRVAREREKVSEIPNISENELITRSNRLDCKEYVLDNGLSLDLLDVIDTNDVAAFKEKAGKLQDIIKSNKHNSYPIVPDGGEPMKLTDPNIEIKKAFSASAAHKPKKTREW